MAQTERVFQAYPERMVVDNLISSSSRDTQLIEMKHQRIVDGACQLFFKKGYHLTTIREIANACGMSMGQLYHYISTKDDILYLVHKHMQKVWYEQLNTSGVELIKDPLQRLEKVLRHTLEFIDANKKLLQFVYSESKYLDKKHLKVILEMDAKNVVGYFRRLLEDINRQNKSKKDLDFEANLVAYLTVFLALRGWNLKNNPTKKSINSLIDFVFRGMGLAPQ